MKKIKITLIFFIITILLFGCGTKVKNGFVKGNDGWTYYYINDEMKTGWQQINGSWYYFYESDYVDGEYKGIGSMKYNTWLKEGNDWFYFKDDGKMLANSWLNDEENSKKYYFGGDGKMLVNTQKEINGTIYIFDAEGNGKVKPDINVVFQGLNKYMYADNYYISIDNYTYDIKKSYSDTYSIDFDFECTVLKKGKWSDGTLMFNWKVIDSNGYSIKDGHIYCSVGSGKARGEKFKFQDSISGLEKGDYIIKFSDYKDYGVYYW